MQNFIVRDGNANEYEQGSIETCKPRLYPVGFSVKLIEWCGQLSPPYPVLVA
jgi:hypothetical protein